MPGGNMGYTPPRFFMDRRSGIGRAEKPSERLILARDIVVRWGRATVAFGARVGERLLDAGKLGGVGAEVFGICACLLADDAKTVDNGGF